MDLSRRQFLALSGTTAAALAAGCAAIGPSAPAKPGLKARASRKPGVLTERPEVKYGTITTTICPYCGVGCGEVVTSAKVNGKMKIVNIEGDPDHPINEGSLCPKGAALYQVGNNDLRLKKVLYRAPGTSKWKEVSWGDALNHIADRIKKTRDQHFIETNAKGQQVNRVEAIASLGGAALDSEECYAWSKFTRSVGMLYIEHQARI